MSLQIRTFVKVHGYNVNFAPIFVFNPPPPLILESCIKIKVNLKFYFHIYLWCLKRFYEGL